MEFLKQFWINLTRNPIVVAAYSAAAGAVGSYLTDAFKGGNFSVAAINWTQMGGVAAAAALLAVAHLLTPAPGANPKAGN
jgi:hypothetical protein